jgi:hypothetical protein
LAGGPEALPDHRRGSGGTGKKLRSPGGTLELFLYRLALEFGIWDVEAWKRQITLSQLARWLAFYRVEPFGMAWRRTARLAVTLASAFGAKVSSDAEDMFCPGFDPSRPTQTEEEMLRELAKLKIPPTKAK